MLPSVGLRFAFGVKSRISTANFIRRQGVVDWSPLLIFPNEQYQIIRLSLRCVQTTSATKSKSQNIPRSAKIVLVTSVDGAEIRTTMPYRDAIKEASKQQQDLALIPNNADIPEFTLKPFTKEQMEEKEDKLEKNKPLRQKELIINSRIEEEEFDRKKEAFMKFLQKGHEVKITIKKSTADNMAAYEKHVKKLSVEIANAVKDIAKSKNQKISETGRVMVYSPLQKQVSKPPKIVPMKMIELREKQQQNEEKTAEKTESGN